MGITSKLFLDERHIKKTDGTCRLKLRVTIDRQSIEIPLPFTLSPDDWNENKSQVKPRAKSIGDINSTRLNYILSDMHNTAMSKLIELQSSGELHRFTMQEIKDRLTGKEQSTPYLLSYFEELIEELKFAGRHGNARVYDMAKRSLATYLKEKNKGKDKDIKLASIDYRFLKTYEAWYLSRGNQINGLATLLRTLRALLNRAIKEKRLSRDNYPFSEYQIQHEKTRKRALAPGALSVIKSYKPQTQRQDRARDYFLFSYFAMGASFIDMAYLKVSDINDGRILYKRKKTGHLHNILITPPMKEILDKYVSGKKPSDFIFNVISAKDPAAQYNQVRNELKRYNRTLKKIGTDCGIGDHLSSYVSRHSYASTAKRIGVPTNVISEALGHSNVEVTEIYLASFDQSVIDEHHLKVISE